MPPMKKLPWSSMASGAVRNRFTLWPDWPDTLVPRATISIRDVTKWPVCACLIVGFLLALARQRVRSDLELRDLAFRPFAALDVPHEMRPVVRVQRATFPAGVGIVDPAVHPA